ncbi:MULTISPECIES: hypothetical protein [unclassified Streptomyces]|uniref:hypothetical protein n=1 Tax=unclassified Streptomyces TaxID=2593676 RepID=UPI002965F7FF|nr:hypothetical protein [Streptomyces sp. SJL17-1]
MALDDRCIDLRRDPHSGEVLAHGGDAEAHGILQRTGFIHVIRQVGNFHWAPAGLNQAAEDALATGAVSALRSAGYWVACDEPFDTDRHTAHRPPLGAQVAALADDLREATTTQDAAAILTELTAAHDGVLSALAQVLDTAAEFLGTLDLGFDRHTATVVRGLNDHHLAIVATEVHRLRDELANRHEAHPARRPCPTSTLPPRPPAPAPPRRL